MVDAGCFPRTEHGSALFGWLNALIDDLTWSQDDRHLGDIGDAANFVDTESLQNFRWYEDTDITSYVGGPCLAIIASMVPAMGLNTARNVSAEVGCLQRPGHNPVRARVEQNLGPGAPGECMCKLIKEDTLDELESVVNTCEQFSSTPPQSDMEKLLRLVFLVSNVDSLRFYSDYLFLSGLRCLPMLDLRIYVELMFLTVCCSIPLELRRPPDIPGKYSRGVSTRECCTLRHLAFRAWIRWGWYTKDKEKNRRDLYIAIGCLEEAIVADFDMEVAEGIAESEEIADAQEILEAEGFIEAEGVAEEEHANERVAHIIKLAQFYRISHKYSGVPEELRNGMNWCRIGIEMLLEMHGEEQLRENNQILLIRAQYELSLMLHKLFILTSDPLDLSTALECAKNAESGIQSSALALTSDDVRNAQFNYRYLRAKYVFGLDDSLPSMPVRNELFTLDPFGRRFTEQLLNIQNPDSFLASQSLTDDDAADDWLLQSGETLLSACPEDRLELMALGKLSWKSDADWREQCGNLLVLSLLRKSTLGSGYFLASDLARIRQMLEHCQNIPHKAALYGMLYARTGNKNDREASIAALPALIDNHEVWPDPDDKWDFLIASEMYFDRYHETGAEQDLINLGNSLLECTKLARLLRGANYATSNSLGLFFPKDLFSPRLNNLLGSWALKTNSLNLDSSAVSSAITDHFYHWLYKPQPSGFGLARSRDASLGDLRQSIRFPSPGHLAPNSPQSLVYELDAIKTLSMQEQIQSGMVLASLLESGTIPNLWTEEYVRALDFLLSLVPQLFHLGSHISERVMYRKGEGGLNVIDFLVRSSNTILTFTNPSLALKFLEVGRGVIFQNFIDYRADLVTLNAIHPYYAREIIGIMGRLETGLVDSIQFPDPYTCTEAWVKRIVQLGSRGRDVRRLQMLLKDIREIPGYETFMRSEYKGDLWARSAATQGPIVVVSACGGGHAIIVTTEAISSISLEGLKEEDARRNLQVLSEDLFLWEGQKNLKKTLSWLWDVVVWPVICHLGLRKENYPPSVDTVLETPRLWWIGVGLMSQAPFHAAGHYVGVRAPHSGKKLKYTGQYCISSYTPTIRALLFSRGQRGHRGPQPRAQPTNDILSSCENVDTHIQHNRVCSPAYVDPSQFRVPEDKGVKHAHCTLRDDALPDSDRNESILQDHRCLLVTMANTPLEAEAEGNSITARGSILCPLNVAAEVEAIKKVLREGGSHVDALASPEAPDVLFAMQHYNIIQLACHGEANQSDPLQSRLVFQKSVQGEDGRRTLIRDYLTIENILKARLGQSEEHPLRLIYLSACSTASNKSGNMTDEPLHIAGVFQLTGFNHAIGTLWDSNDDVCVKIAQNFYEYLFMFERRNRNGKFKNGKRFGGCAEALHLAVDEVRRDNGLWKAPYLWAPFMHWGV